MVSQTSKLRTDILDNEPLTQALPTITFDYVYNLFIENARTTNIAQTPLKTLGPAKELNDCFVLIKQAIQAKENVEKTIQEARLSSFGWEEPTTELELETISILPTKRLPGTFSGGGIDKSMGQRVREIVPHLREEGVDEEDHNYRTAVLGQMYDNWVDFTCWARTNKAAFNRSVWFEDLIREYRWYFTMLGIGRIINQGTKNRRTKNIGDNIIYGYPVEVFIRTEKIFTVSEKIFERLIVEIGLSTS